MILQLILFDIPADPAGIGGLLAVVLLVLGLIALLAVLLVVFLWYHKRSLRNVEMIRKDPLPQSQAQLHKAKQP